VRFLLDTNICAAHLRNHPRVCQKIQQHGGQLAISAVTWAELITWAARKQAPSARMTSLRAFLGDVVLLPLDQAVAETCGQLRAAQFDAGLPIAEMDLLIAATAIHHGLIVVTNNVKDFESIQGVAVQDWTTT
jgi:tRNA(fMet)-specific endonuclease VapC